MIYLLCFLCPPLALLLKGRIFNGFASLFLYLGALLLFPLYFVAVIHAILVIRGAEAQRRHRELIESQAAMIQQLNAIAHRRMDDR